MAQERHFTSAPEWAKGCVCAGTSHESDTKINRISTRTANRLKAEDADREERILKYVKAQGSSVMIRV